jgi:hypothetical protein
MDTPRLATPNSQSPPIDPASVIVATTCRAVPPFTQLTNDLYLEPGSWALEVDDESGHLFVMSANWGRGCPDSKFLNFTSKVGRRSISQVLTPIRSTICR